MKLPNEAEAELPAAPITVEPEVLEAALAGTPKKTRRRRAAAAPANRTKTVRVRMYRQGLGDCFLITFPREPKPFHMLIDCGVLLGTPDATSVMTAVAQDIRKETRQGPGRSRSRIDVVVASHEHWDHLSGFLQARTVFDQIDVGEVWFAWTEDPANPRANELCKDRAARLTALRQAFQRMRMVGAASPNLNAVEEVLGFFGDLPAAGGRGSTADALEYLRTKSSARVRYLSPGREPLTLPGVGGVRVYVLGPPEDVALLKRSDPTKRGREVYDEDRPLTPEWSFYAGFDNSPAGTPGADLKTRAEPFDSYYKVGVEEVKRNPATYGFFHDRYGFAGMASSGEDWRRIDSDWMTMAGELALKLDSDTNNTSLVLAIELVESGRVLLFPADAQVGNWLSWGTHSWAVRDQDGNERSVDSEDLLRRTVLYKVGHHGSHNATLRGQGLELMESPDLVALVPVSKEMAERKRWNMPFPALLKRLHEKTRGRVIRLDDGAPGEQQLKATLTASERAEFLRVVDDRSDGLCIDYRLEM